MDDETDTRARERVGSVLNDKWTLEALIGMGGMAAVYAARHRNGAKAAVKLLTEGLQGECAGTAVHVTAVYPGAIGTDILKNSGVEGLGGAGSAEAAAKTLPPARAAELIVDAIEKNRPRVMVGRDARALDVLTRLAPVRSASLIARQLKKLTTPKEQS